jgi:hypothetical protein
MNNYHFFKLSLLPQAVRRTLCSGTSSKPFIVQQNSLLSLFSYQVTETPKQNLRLLRQTDSKKVIKIYNRKPLINKSLKKGDI